MGNPSSRHLQVEGVANAIYQWCLQTHNHPPGSPFPHLKGVFFGLARSPTAFFTYQAPTNLSTNKPDCEGSKQHPCLESISGHNYRGKVYNGGDVNELVDDENNENSDDGDNTGGSADKSDGFDDGDKSDSGKSDDFDDGDKSDGGKSDDENDENSDDGDKTGGSADKSDGFEDGDKSDGDKSDGFDEGDKSDGFDDDHYSKGAKKRCKKCEALLGANPAASDRIRASIHATHVENLNPVARANLITFARERDAVREARAVASAEVAPFEGAAMSALPGLRPVLRAASFSFPVPGLRPGMRATSFSPPVLPPAACVLFCICFLAWRLPCLQPCVDRSHVYLVESSYVCTLLS